MFWDVMEVLEEKEEEGEEEEGEEFAIKRIFERKEQFRPLSAVEMTLNPVSMADSYSEEKIVDLVQRLKRVENWIDERLNDEEDSDCDFEGTEKLEDDQERSDDFLGIFPDEWLTPRRQASELKRFMEFCKAGSIRMNNDIFNSFIPEMEKNFFTRHTDASWNALAVTGVTAEGRKDSPEAVRVMELLQPALESEFEAANAIAALTTRELRKTHLEDEEKKRLRGLFCSYTLIADSLECWWRVPAFLIQKGMFQGAEHPPFPPQPSALSQPGADAQGGTAQAGTLRASLTDSSKSMASMEASRISEKKRGPHKPCHSMPQQQLGEWPRSQFPFPQIPRGYREDQQQAQLLDRANGPRRSEGEGGRALP
ncbi:uncharacterized protein MONOS_6428 [Monocercomonoides exilis]|uniref:uncharacterized protein n=1 Tax=Monocercomonoides exilis TaxID=2049356 RepID=UPI00355A61FC|nr:hypothetical protein MONOS_6428 [Monocercomonoides exilis]|eukprot:MONOS_6428.1-p1 / transcript=MONOS_6428.1 / gene=MONOS_6428 / organism=Monocercomonoides_exilis_PA203 / gene_product=unspecified product / transcript_product=unspecified product / location=Mono_scaffold00202:47427-48909(-) / protein_length=368 / sequence_SO=supercontig / SO=protein_coding / is_pseudo=false